MALVDLRGPCNHLAARLDTELRVIRRKCPQCSKRHGTPVFHDFDAETGALLEGANAPPRRSPETSARDEVGITLR